MDFGKLILRIFDFAKDYILSQNKNTRPAGQARATQASAYQEEVKETERTDAEWEAYFREILQDDFSSYTIRENVPVTDLAGFANDEAQLYSTRPRQAYKAEWGKPYTFVLESGGSAKGVVMLGNGHSHDSNVKYLIARMYAKKLGLPYINFYTQMPNERDYVIGRIRKFMG
ncbi:MAG: hypothetical protein J5913_03510 [Prevotella sp.]|nr:hypothetical protein [Prevotella sp.]MBP3219553.1 hypothetical protein [Prevotella sp.]